MVDRIEVHDAFLPQDLLDHVLSFVSNLAWKHGWHSSPNVEFTQFNVNFGQTHVSNREDITDAIQEFDNQNQTPLSTVWKRIRDNVIGVDHKLLRCYANLTLYGNEGYPHRDTTPDFEDDITTLLYCCTEWKPKFGGETAIFDPIGDIAKSIMPRKNRLILFPALSLHTARSVSRVCNLPRIVLVFKSGPR